MITQEDKDLLLKDLCARLPYGVICYWRIGSELTLNLTEYNGQLTCINKVEIENSSDYYYDCYFNVCNDSNGNSFQNEDVSIEIVKPYLRPMSSMTEEEKEELRQEQIKDEQLFADCIKNHPEMRGLIIPHFAADWCDKNMFDYRGLIKRGLAIEAPEGMYNLKFTKKYFPSEFSSYEDYVKYLKEKGFAIEVTEENNPHKNF